MKLARSDVEYQLNNLQGMVYAACRMGAWCFNDKKQLFLLMCDKEVIEV